MGASSLRHQAKLCLLAGSPVWEIPSFWEHSWGDEFFCVFEKPPSPVLLQCSVDQLGGEGMSRSHPRSHPGVPQTLLFPSWSPLGSAVPILGSAVPGSCVREGEVSLELGWLLCTHTAQSQAGTACSPLKQVQLFILTNSCSKFQLQPQSILTKVPTVSVEVA